MQALTPWWGVLRQTGYGDIRIPEEGTMKILIKKSEAAFFHSGLVLFLIPSTLIILRFMDYMLFEGRSVEIFCSASLMASVCCFLFTYYAEEL
jgi:putative effector of murein hydrolase LrgA (UPF0299 family)